MTDLAERFARSQGWTYLPESQTWRAPDGPYRNVAIDVSILPIIWADCKAKGWTWEMDSGGGSIWKTGHMRFIILGADPIAAFCEAYCKAREAE